MIDAVPSADAPRACVPTPATAARPATPAPVTSATAPPAITTATDAAPAPAIADADRLPPPVLFECRTYDNDCYLSDDGLPPQRCAPMTTTGIGGGPGAGESCQMVSDQCQHIADGALCENWKARLREAQGVLRFGRHDIATPRRPRSIA